MRINANTVLFGRAILLVPYRKHHVPKYHTWMKNEEIRELTASLPLSIEEEFAMQETWLNDNDKCTFIILSKEIYDRTHNEIESMIGDVNLFLNDADDVNCAELEIMIAETTVRQKGCATDALCTFLRYAVETLNLTRFVVKIGLTNAPSIALFSKKFNFQTIQTSEVFQEVTMERKVDNDFIDMLRSKTPDYKCMHYDQLNSVETPL